MNLFISVCLDFFQVILQCLIVNIHLPRSLLSLCLFTSHSQLVSILKDSVVASVSLHAQIFGWFRRPRPNHLWIVWAPGVRRQLHVMTLYHKVLRCSPRIVWEKSLYDKLIVSLCGRRVFCNFSQNQPSDASCTDCHWDYILHSMGSVGTRQDHLQDTAVNNHQAFFMRFVNHQWFAFLKKYGVNLSTNWFNHQGV